MYEPNRFLMNAIPKLYQRHRLSVVDYHQMEDMGIFAQDARVELINGEIITTAPIGNRHMSAVDRLTKCLVLGVGDEGIVRVQGSGQLDSFSEPTPDLLLLRPRSDFYANESAGASDVLLLIEVSESNLRYDNEVKLPLYSRVGISEVWIVDLKAGRLNRFANPVAGGCETQNSPTDLSNVAPVQLKNVSLDVSALFD